MGKWLLEKERKAEMSKKKTEPKRPVENTLRRIALWRGYYSLAAQYLRKLEKEDESCLGTNQDRSGAYGTALQRMAAFSTDRKSSL